MLICVDILRDTKGNITKYAIQNSDNGAIDYYELTYMKDLLRSHQLEVTNLNYSFKNDRIYSKSQFQEDIDKHNKKNNRNSKVSIHADTMETYADTLMQRLVKEYKNNGIEFYGLETSGDTNCFCVKLANLDCHLVVRYRKQINGNATRLILRVFGFCF